MASLNASSSNAATATTSDADAAVAALLEKIEPNPLECRICLKELTARTTAMLPCCHTFHRACLKQQAEAHRGQTLRCGVCGTEAVGVKESADVEKLPTDGLVEAEVAEHVQCGICQEEGDEEVFDAVAFCKTCSKPLCDSHRGLHKKKAFAGHVVEMLHSTANAQSCHEHSGKPLEVYCVTCKNVCCSLCVVKTHKAPDHETVVLADHTPVLRMTLERVRTTATQRSKDLVQRLVGLHSTLGEVDSRTALLEDEVRRTIKVLMQRLAMREEELLRELWTQTAQERAALEAEQGEDQRRWLALQGALRTAQRLAAPESSADNLGLMAAPVEEFLTTASRDPVTIAPPAALITFTVSQDLDRVLSSVGQFVQSRAYGPDCVAEGVGTTKATVSAGGRFTVTAWTRSKERVTVGGDRVTARLVSAADGSASEATVIDAGDGSYTVSYTMASAGEYRLEVAVNGRAVRGSPFSVAVSAGRLFTFAGPPYYDGNGVIYYLATSGGTRPWTNPHDAGVVTVSFSSDAGWPTSRFVANNTPADGEWCNTKNSLSSWITVSLNGRRVVPTGYVLSADGHGAGGHEHFLRSWRLEASVGGLNWTTLREHRNDKTLTRLTLTGYWPVHEATSAFSHFRILQTGKNSSNNDHLMATSFEIYGELLDL